MLRDTSGQDVLVPTNERNITKLLKWGLPGLIITITLAASIPSLASMFSSDINVSKQNLRFATVINGDIQRDIGVQGRVVAANSPTLYATAPGIVSLFVKAGDSVTKDQTLAQIKSPQLTNRYEQELATLEQLSLAVESHRIAMRTTELNTQQQIEFSEVNLEAAQINKTRAETSMEDNLISKKEFEETISAFKIAELNHQHALQNFELEKDRMAFELKSRQSQQERQQFVVDDLARQVEELTLVAPTDGIIGSVNIREKDNVAESASLITVIDLSAFEIEVNIPETYADALGVGLDSEISFNGKTHAGTVVAISPEVNNGQVVGRLRFSQESPAKLRQNQRVTARILMESKENTLKVKRGAFVESGGGRIVYRVDGNNAKRQTVSFGARSIGEIEVLSGLKAGDTIVISSIDAFNEHEKVFLSN